jgi:hypothetical protein
MGYVRRQIKTTEEREKDRIDKIKKRLLKKIGYRQKKEL